MTVGGFPTGAFMSYSTDQLRKDNALGEYELSPEEEEIAVIHAPSPPAAPFVAKQPPVSASSGGE